jgi:hypothetical protein
MAKHGRASAFRESEENKRALDRLVRERRANIDRALKKLEGLETPMPHPRCTEALKTLMAGIGPARLSVIRSALRFQPTTLEEYLMGLVQEVFDAGSSPGVL